jgi:hypothetical protein
MDILKRNEGLFPEDNLSSSPREKKKEKRKPRVRKINRNQMVLHPVEIERLIPDDHEVRAIWELTGSLDLSCYYERVDARDGTAGATFRRETTLREHLRKAEDQLLAMEEASEEEMTPRIQKARERAVRERKERLVRALDELEAIRSQKRVPIHGQAPPIRSAVSWRNPTEAMRRAIISRYLPMQRV